MKLRLIAIVALTIVSNVYGKQTNSGTIAICPNIGLFHIDSLKEGDVEGKRLREFNLSLVKQLKGKAPHTSLFKSLVNRER